MVLVHYKWGAFRTMFFSMIWRGMLNITEGLGCLWRIIRCHSKTERKGAAICKRKVIDTFFFQYPIKRYQEMLKIEISFLIQKLISKWVETCSYHGHHTYTFFLIYYSSKLKWFGYFFQIANFYPWDIRRTSPIILPLSQCITRNSH